MTQEHKLAFDMLDKRRDGFLTQPDARVWLRTQGCCLCDEDMDRYILSRVQNGKFTLIELSKLSSFAIPGMAPDSEKLKHAIETVARSSDVTVTDLRARLLDNGMTAAEFEAFRHSLKLAATNITSEELTRKIVTRISSNHA